jgi:hypothetical protein
VVHNDGSVTWTSSSGSVHNYSSVNDLPSSVADAYGINAGGGGGGGGGGEYSQAGYYRQSSYYSQSAYYFQNFYSAGYSQSAYYWQNFYYSQQSYYSQSAYYWQNFYYSQQAYYSQAAYYSQNFYYSQSAYYSQSSYCYSQSSYSSYSQSAYYSQNFYYSQSSYYSQSAYYWQNLYYSQSSYYSQSAYYSQNFYYSQSSYYSQSAYYSQNFYYSQSSYYGQSGYYRQSGYYGQSGYYRQSSYSCFIGDEMVLTPNGEVRIADVTPGTKVISYDDKTGKFTTSIVSDVIVHTQTLNPHDFDTYPLLKVTIQDRGVSSVTEVTANHPYLDPKTGEYKEIGSFEVGDTVQTINGEGVITNVDVLINGEDSKTQTIPTLYDLHMGSGPANYLVDGVVVHNKAI